MGEILFDLISSIFIGQDIIPWISRWDLMVVPHWSGRNSTMVAWWCLIGQDVIPWPLLVGVHGDASYLGRKSTKFVVVPHYII